MPDTWDGLIDTAILSSCMNIFGSSVTYMFKSGGSQIIAGVFDEQFLAQSPLGSGPFSSTESMSMGAPGSIVSAKPVLGVQLSQFQQPPSQGDTLSVVQTGGDAVTYIVRQVQADGHGGALLALSLVKRP